jgi:hypothetical protein
LVLYICNNISVFIFFHYSISTVTNEYICNIISDTD